jgi:hypothetical protein
MVIELFKWWYSSGWLKAFNKTHEWTNGVRNAFSISILLKTLFSPWKQIISSPGKSLDAKFRAALDNFISRIVGFFVRICVLFTSLIMLVGAVVGGFIVGILWPFIPVFFVYFIVRSITG